MEVPAVHTAREGHTVQCHLYEGAIFPAEPVPIDGPEAQAARARKQATAEKAAPEGEWDRTTGGFSAFEGSEDMDGRNLGIPAVLADRGDIQLGPFGEVIDPEDTFVGTVDVPTLGSMIGDPDTTVRRAIPSPAIPKNTGADPDATATLADMPTMIESGPRRAAPLGTLTDSIPPIHDDEGIPDDVSLHAATGGIETLEEQETARMDVPRASGSPDDDPTMIGDFPGLKRGDD